MCLIYFWPTLHSGPYRVADGPPQTFLIPIPCHILFSERTVARRSGPPTLTTDRLPWYGWWSRLHLLRFVVDCSRHVWHASGYYISRKRQRLCFGSVDLCSRLLKKLSVGCSEFALDEKEMKSQNLAFRMKKTKFTILQEIWTKIRNLEEILDKIDFGWTKYEILDKIFLVFLNMLVAQCRISADIKSTLIFQWNKSTVI